MQKDLPAYLKLVQNGETLSIAPAGEPLAELKPLLRSGPELRPFGLCAGEFSVPQGFDEPLPEELLAAFAFAALYES